MMVFTEAEKQIREVKFSDLNPEESPASDEVENEDLHTVVEYVASGAVVLDRLEAMGFTLQATRALYERDHAHRIPETTSAEAFERYVGGKCLVACRGRAWRDIKAWIIAPPRNVDMLQASINNRLDGGKHRRRIQS